jgi:hypothetical protein
LLNAPAQINNIFVVSTKRLPFLLSIGTIRKCDKFFG